MKVLGIANADITVDTRNEPVTFHNTYVKPYNCQMEETDICYLEMTNGLAEICIDKSSNEEISMPLDYPEPRRLCWCVWPLEDYFITDFTNWIATIFISYGERANYELASQLWYEKIIITPRDLFKQSDPTKIESLLANGVL